MSIIVVINHYIVLLVNGWAEYEYKLNPANVNPQYYTGISFVEQTATTTTRATEVGLPFG